jgi:spermidine/putrescine-binding protein
MKALKILALLIFLGILAVFIFTISIYSGTTWGGWTPPDPSLKLDVKEIKWQEAFEKKNDCSITYIGLDGGYQEDTIIYMLLEGRRNTEFIEKIATNGAIVTQEICRQFLASSTTKRPQQYIEVTYNKIKIPTAKYPVDLRFLYAIKTGLAQKIED